MGFFNQFKNALMQSDPIKLTLVGDSITWGVGASGMASTLPRSKSLSDVRNNHSCPCWVNLLRHGISPYANCFVDVVNEGISGTHTIYWLPGKRLYSAVEQDTDFIILMLGTNDRVEIDGWNNTPGRIHENLERIIRPVINRGVSLALMTPPPAVKDYPKEPYIFDLESVSCAVRECANKLGLDLFDHYRAWMSLGNISDYLKDGLHPNNKGHALIYENLLKAIFTPSNQSIGLRFVNES